jgi:RimJ/RimL family protein N-acetyltransferase
MAATVELRDTQINELSAFCDMEQDDCAVNFVRAYPLERHQQEFARKSFIYKSVYHADHLVGFVVLILDDDGRSLELKRIVIAERNKGFGKEVLAAIPQICRELDRSRIWLDVFDDNERARHVYEAAGCTNFGSRPLEERTLLLYELIVSN